MWPHRAPVLKGKHTDTHANKHMYACTHSSRRQVLGKAQSALCCGFSWAHSVLFLGYELRTVGTLKNMTQGHGDLAVSMSGELLRMTMPTAASAAEAAFYQTYSAPGTA